MTTPLANLIPGRSGVITQIDIAGPRMRRVAELGLRPGVSCHVVTRTSGGGIVIAVHDGRLALDRETATAIRVSVAAGVCL